MKQYNQVKGKYPDAILLFRVGDFYETFGLDAVKTSKILGIVLTKRGAGSTSETELAGFPYHALNNYLPKLVRAGHRVAICDQLENPKLAKKIVKRGVTELITPGVALTDGVLETDKNNFLGAIYIDSNKIGLAYVDVSTGEFFWTQGNNSEIKSLIHKLEIKEILISKSQKKQIFDIIDRHLPIFILEDWVFNENYSKEKIYHHFEVKTLKGYGLKASDPALIASGAVIHYLIDTHHSELKHISKIQRVQLNEQFWMDEFTIRNLELINSNSSDGVSLLETIDFTSTQMGPRLLRRWITNPLTNVKSIDNRLNSIESIVNYPNLSDFLIENLKHISDIERLAAKIATRRITPREANALKSSLKFSETIFNKISELDSIQRLISKNVETNELQKLIGNYLNADAPTIIGKGDTIKAGLSKELDDLRKISRDGKKTLEDMLEREINNTGISSLKISFNNVFGYYIEVRNIHKDKVPVGWIRKQTLVNAERYITEELKDYENKILGAEENILSLENKLFNELLSKMSNHINSLQMVSSDISKLDVICGFSCLSLKYNFSKPKLNSSSKLKIVEGRHPVIERQLPAENPYIPNDIYLDNKEQQILMITGPNMSGKSAILRQTALIVILAQIGCYVPAKESEIGIIDKLFTRVGANDNLSKGESTFMVEMFETAAIINNLSNKSLILLDEIGRGTSTYDGISIAWAIAEYLHNHPNKAKTLFATHYHELNGMSSEFERIKNFNVSVKETGDDVLFLRKLVPGGSAHSFGIHVAKMAGMPKWILSRSKEILKQLEKTRKSEIIDTDSSLQLNMFEIDDPLLSEIREQINSLEIDEIKPIEALMILNELRRKLSKN